MRDEADVAKRDGQ